MHEIHAIDIFEDVCEVVGPCTFPTTMIRLGCAAKENYLESASRTFEGDWKVTETQPVPLRLAAELKQGG